MQKRREEQDLEILNQKADDLNEEAEDVLSYQVDLCINEALKIALSFE